MAACCGPGGSWWGIAAPQGTPAGFSSKASFLEAEQDARAGGLDALTKVNIYKGDPLLPHWLRGRTRRNLTVQRFPPTQHEGVWAGRRLWIMGAGRPGEGSGSADKEPAASTGAQNTTSLESSQRAAPTCLCWVFQHQHPAHSARTEPGQSRARERLQLVGVKQLSWAEVGCAGS